MAKMGRPPIVSNGAKLTTWVDGESAARIKAIAKITGRSESFVLREIVFFYLNGRPLAKDIDAVAKAS